MSRPGGRVLLGVIVSVCLLGGLLTSASAQQPGSELVSDLSTDPVDRIELVDASAFAVGGGAAIIEPGTGSQERITYTGLDGNSLIGVSRTVPVAHQAGSFVAVEQAEPSSSPAPHATSSPEPVEPSPPQPSEEPAPPPADTGAYSAASSDTDLTLAAPISESDPANLGALGLTGGLQGLPPSGAIVIEPGSPAEEIVFYLGVTPDGVTDIYRVDPQPHAQGANVDLPTVAELVQTIVEQVDGVDELLAGLIGDFCPDLQCVDQVRDAVMNLVAPILDNLCDASSCAGIIVGLAQDLIEDLCPSLQCYEPVVDTITRTVVDLIYRVCPGGALACEQMIEDLVFGVLDQAIGNLCGGAAVPQCAQDRLDVVVAIVEGVVATIFARICPQTGASPECIAELSQTIDGVVATAIKAICSDTTALGCAGEKFDVVKAIVDSVVALVIERACPQTGASPECIGEISDRVADIVGNAIIPVCGGLSAADCANQKAWMVIGIVDSAVDQAFRTFCPNTGNSPECVGELNDLIVRTVQESLVAVCGSADTAICKDTLIGRVDGLLWTACGLVPVAPAGDATGIPPGAGRCVLKVLGTVQLVMNTACGSTEAVACAGNLLDEADGLVASACGLVTTSQTDAEPDLGDGADACVLKVLETVDVVLTVACGTANPEGPETCTAKLLGQIDETLALACGTVPIEEGQAAITIPPGMRTCVLKALGTIDLIYQTVCGSQSAAACVVDLIDSINEMLRGFCESQSGSSDTGSTTGDPCLDLLSELVGDLLFQLCQGADASACIDKVGPVVQGLVGLVCSATGRDCTVFLPLLEDCAAGSVPACSALVMAVACPSQQLGYLVVLVTVLNCVPPPPVSVSCDAIMDCPLSIEDLVDVSEDIESELLYQTPLGAYAGTIFWAMNDLGINPLLVEALGLESELDQQVSKLADDLLIDWAEEATSGPIADVNQALDKLIDAGLLVGGYENLNDEEKRVCRNNPYDCWRSRNTPTDSKKWAKTLYGQYDPVDTPRDAFRHCMWSALMTKRSNADFAKKMGDAHEEHPNTKAGQMDLHNNSWGRVAGYFTDDNWDVGTADECVEYEQEGYLQRYP